MSETEQAIVKKTCNRCQHSWWPKKPGDPVHCPKCLSPYWNKERVYKLTKRQPAKSRAASGKE